MNKKRLLLIFEHRKKINAHIQIKNPTALLVEPVGFEPTSRQGRDMLSTCLASA